jgi:hypothetical protein
MSPLSLSKTPLTDKLKEWEPKAKPALVKEIKDLIAQIEGKDSEAVVKAIEALTKARKEKKTSGADPAASAKANREAADKNVNGHLQQLKKDLNQLLQQIQGAQSQREQAFEKIAQFRKDNKLPKYRQLDGSSGTVALVEVNGKPYYGLNSELRGSVKGFAFSDAARKKWFDRLKAAGKLKGLSEYTEAQFLQHAEAQALIRALPSTGTFGGAKVVLYVDRPTCGYACRPRLPDLLGDLGISEMEVNWLNAAHYPSWTVRAT